MKFLQRTADLDNHTAKFLFKRAKEQREYVQKEIEILQSHSHSSPEIDVLRLQHAMTTRIARMFQEHKASVEIIKAIENISPRGYDEFPIELSIWRENLPTIIIDILIVDTTPTKEIPHPSEKGANRVSRYKRRRHKYQN